MHSVSPITFLQSWRQSRGKAALFDQLNAYILFIGHPRSGSSVTGSLLNAHRNALVCNELNVLRYVKHGYRRRTQLLWLHCMRDGYFENLGRTWTGYDYRVRGAHQGAVERLDVIGDKKASRTSEALAKSSAPLHQLQEIVQTPVRLVHVMRHPLDVIGRVCLREKITAEASAQRFFARCDTVQRVLEENEFPIHTIYLEEMIAAPRQVLPQLAEFCQLDPEPDYVDRCAATLLDKPRHSRDKVDWPPGAEQRIMAQAADYSCVQRYVDNHGSSRAA